MAPINSCGAAQLLYSSAGEGQAAVCWLHDHSNFADASLTSKNRVFVTRHGDRDYCSEIPAEAF